MMPLPPIPVTINGRPNGCVEGWNEPGNPLFIPVKENGEPLVSIRNSVPEIISRPVYQASQGEDQFVRHSVADMLAKAQSFLPDGLQLVLFDGWRSIELQRQLYEQEYAVQASRLYGRDQASIVAETQRYVSVPSSSGEVPSPHNTGGAVDVAIMKDDELLDFGTRHDDMSERSALVYAEMNASLGVAARDNRRMLYYAMTKAGFEPYVDEWWHYNYGNQMAQLTHYYRTGERLPAIYGPRENVIQ